MTTTWSWSRVSRFDNEYLTTYLSLNFNNDLITTLTIPQRPEMARRTAEQAEEALEARAGQIGLGGTTEIEAFCSLSNWMGLWRRHRQPR